VGGLAEEGLEVCVGCGFEGLQEAGELEVGSLEREALEAGDEQLRFDGVVPVEAEAEGLCIDELEEQQRGDQTVLEVGQGDGAVCESAG